MEQAIKQSLKGGWRPEEYKLWLNSPNTVEEYNKGVPVLLSETNGMKYACFLAMEWPLSEILLDPLWWQALCKDIKVPNEQYGQPKGEIWAVEIHKFIDHIIEGKDIDSFFTNLLQSNGK